MAEIQPARRYRFGVFEADAATGELRRQGARVRLSAQPFQVLCLLLARPGDLLTREEISRELWPDGTFVDFEQGVRSAVNRVREALGDTAGNPRFIETLARRGYRFVAPVEAIGIPARGVAPETSLLTVVETPEPESAALESSLGSQFLATPADLPRTSSSVVKTLFILLQVMYLSFYIGALANLAEIEELISVLQHPTKTLLVMLITAAMLIPVRLFLLCAVLFHAPRIREQILTIWPLLLVADVLWSLAPFLLLHHISFGLALSCTAILAYAPFAQRSLVLMGAGRRSA